MTVQNNIKTPVPEPSLNGEGLQNVGAAIERSLGESDLSALLLSSGLLGDSPEEPTPDPADPADAEAPEDPSLNRLQTEDPEDPEADTPPEDPEEQEEQDEEQDAAQDEEEQDDANKLPPDLQKRVDRRVNQEVRKRKYLEYQIQTAKEAADAKISELQEQLESAKQALPSRPPGAAPLSAVQTEADLARTVEATETVLDFLDSAESLLDTAPEKVIDRLRGAGVQLKDADGEEDYSDARINAWIRDTRRAANRTLAREVPKRREYLAQLAHADAQAVQTFPWWKDPKSEEYKEAQKVLAAIPELKRMPHWKYAAAVYVHGLKALKAAAQSATPAAPARPAPRPPLVPSQRRSAPVISAGDTAQASARRRLMETGSERDLENAVLSVLD